MREEGTPAPDVQGEKTPEPAPQQGKAPEKKGPAPQTMLLDDNPHPKDGQEDNTVGDTRLRANQEETAIGVVIYHIEEKKQGVKLRLLDPLIGGEGKISR